jgi:DNA repair protein RadC
MTVNGVVSAQPGLRLSHLACPSCGSTVPFRVQGLTWRVTRPADVADRLVARYGSRERECLIVLNLNAKNLVRTVSEVYTGNVSASLVRVGELFRDAIRLDCSGVIVCHNHPSGDPTPSPDDLHLTAEAIAAGRLLDIDVLDHVIVAATGWISLRDRGVTFDRHTRAAE